MILLVISHTAHYRRPDGVLVGWGSTIQEINAVATSFSKVIHVACLHEGLVPDGMEEYDQGNIEFVPIPSAGGGGVRKLTNLLVAPMIVWRVFGALRRATVFQFRAPTSMGVYLIPLLTIFSRKRGWYKYAGDWSNPKPPASFAFQRFWLARLQRRKVTINGYWPGQPRHCLSFENPCLTRDDVARGRVAVSEKKYTTPYNFVFVGRLNQNKGADIFLRAMLLVANMGNVNHIHIVGDGPERDNLKNMLEGSALNVTFYGFLDRQSVFEVLTQSHILVLPSATEGFPKVVAEAWNCGCVPVVSQVSAIDQYVINKVNGFLIPASMRNAEGLWNILADLIRRGDVCEIAHRGNKEAYRFTYDYYLYRLFNEVIAQ